MIETTLPLPPELWAMVPAPESASLLGELAALQGTAAPSLLPTRRG